MKKLLLTFLLAPCVLSAQTTDLPFQPGGQSAGMGGAQVATASAWGTHHNPGLLPWVESTTIAVGVENRFLLSELNGEGLAAAIPLKTGAIGVGITSHGYSLYRRSRAALSYGLKLSDHLAAGVMVHYDMLALGNNYGSGGAISGSVGFSARLTDDFMIGAYVFNPVRAGFSNNLDEKLSTILAFGASYKFSDKVMVSGEMEKDILYKPGLKLGLEYKPIDIMYLRTGFRTFPQSYTFGFGMDLSNFRADLAAWMHPVLGVSPNLSIQYTFAKK